MCNAEEQSCVMRGTVMCNAEEQSCVMQRNSNV